ncbi:MAG TPA: recombinase family protein [Candidatus Acidoferrum sp.]|nr:recombinase family protein [Candidatus Acidoferrum sp.]
MMNNILYDIGGYSGPNAHAKTPPMASGGLAAFAYGRVSSSAGADGLSRQEQSIEVQDATFRAYLTEIKIPLDCVQFFSERGSGAFKKSDIRKRREGAKLWAAIVECRQQFPNADLHLLLTKVDRVGRGWLATQIMFSELRQMGVKMHIIGLGGRSFDCDSLMGQKMLSDLAFYSELEVTTTRDRIKETINFKFGKRQVCGQEPYGWTSRETGEVTAKGVRIRELVDHPEQQKWILHMAGLRRRGETSYAIAKDLNARKIPTKKGTGNWKPSKIEKILNSKTVQNFLTNYEQSNTTTTDIV